MSRVDWAVELRLPAMGTLEAAFLGWATAAACAAEVSGPATSASSGIWRLPHVRSPWGSVGRRRGSKYVHLSAVAGGRLDR